MEKKTKIDAVGMRRQIRDAHYDRTKDMTREHWLAFYREESQKAQTKLKKLAQQLNKDPA